MSHLTKQKSLWNQWLLLMGAAAAGAAIGLFWWIEPGPVKDPVLNPNAEAVSRGNPSETPGPDSSLDPVPLAESSVAQPEIAVGDWRAALDVGATWDRQSLEAQRAAVRGLRDWAERDLASATAWVTQLADDGAWEALSNAICLHLLEHDPKAALALVDHFRTDGATNGLIATLLASWAERDMETALAWAQARSDPNLRDEFTATVLQAAAYHVPRQAAARVFAIRLEPTREAALRAIVEIWAREDPKLASAYVQALAAGPLRDVGMETVFAVADRERIFREAAMPD